MNECWGAAEIYFRPTEDDAHDIRVAISGGPTHPSSTRRRPIHTSAHNPFTHTHARHVVSILVPRGGGRGRELMGEKDPLPILFLPPHVKRHGRRLNKHHSLRTNPGSAQALVTQQWCTWVGVGKGGVWQKKRKGGCGGVSNEIGFSSQWVGGREEEGLFTSLLRDTEREEEEESREEKGTHWGAYF